MRLLLAIVLMLSVPIAAFAEKTPKGKEPYAVIFGTVVNGNGRPVYGVKVRVRRAEHKKGGYELSSDHSGEFAQRVPPGPADYVAFIEVKGNPQVADSTSVKVHVEKDEQRDIVLHLKEPGTPKTDTKPAKKAKP